VDWGSGVAVAGAAVVPDVPVGEGVAVEAVALAGAALALAAVLGSSVLGVGRVDGDVDAVEVDGVEDGVEDGVKDGVEDDVPLIDAANAVTCVRTSCSFARVGSSSVIEAAGLPLVVVFGAVAVEPVVPAGAGVAAPVVAVEPSSSVRMRSTAATSVLQFALRAVVLPEAGFEADCSSVFKCFFSSATRVFAVPASDAAGMSASADCA
jgi:hypothetical protein